jgi:hypothetical protein
MKDTVRFAASVIKRKRDESVSGLKNGDPVMVP